MAEANPELPVTTIPPFANTKLLPACATDCIPLYDANGQCVPPAVDPGVGSDAFTACFCANTNVAAFSTGVKGVCDNACGGGEGLSSIAGWFSDICTITTDSNANKGNDKPGNQGSSTTTSTGSAATGGSKAGSNNDGGDWLSNHWKWVVMLVILVVGIAAIWIGACIWRRRYLRKKDRQSSLGQKHSGSASRPSWGPGMESGSLATGPYDNSAYNSQRNSHAVFLNGEGSAAAALEEKAPKSPKEKKHWLVSERT